MHAKRATSDIGNTSRVPSFLVKRGFTLVELLVVIAILGVLTALLFPVFGLARKRSNSVKCASNLRQVIVAANLYAGDHRGGFPVLTDPTRGLSVSATSANVGLVTLLLPYANGNASVFYCPEARGDYKYENQRSRPDKQKPYWTMGYYWLPSTGGAISPTPGPLPQTVFGSSLRVFVTCPDFNGWTLHGQRINLAHIDGHVSQAPQGKRVWDAVNFSTLLAK